MVVICPLEFARNAWLDRREFVGPCGCWEARGTGFFYVETAFAPLIN